MVGPRPPADPILGITFNSLTCHTLRTSGRKGKVGAMVPIAGDDDERDDGGIRLVLVASTCCNLCLKDANRSREIKGRVLLTLSPTSNGGIPRLTAEVQEKLVGKHSLAADLGTRKRVFPDPRVSPTDHTPILIEGIPLWGRGRKSLDSDNVRMFNYSASFSG